MVTPSKITLIDTPLSVCSLKCSWDCRDSSYLSSFPCPIFHSAKLWNRYTCEYANNDNHKDKFNHRKSGFLHSYYFATALKALPIAEPIPALRLSTETAVDELISSNSMDCAE